MLKRFSSGLLCAGAFMAACPVFVHAADVAEAEPASLQDIVVTGTRIRAPNLSSESPVTAVTDVEIKAQGATNIENVLNEIPQVHTAQSDGTSNNSTGVANINLRGLGPTRTLVMIPPR
jgi:iron complex outermembrane receptor protein